MTSRAYTIEGKGYRTSGNAPYGGVYRKTRNAAGMSYTTHRATRRKVHKLRQSEGDVLTLSVRGTCDTLPSLAYMTAQSKRICPCCGQRVNARVLNERGKRRLAYLRRYRQQAAA